MPTTALLLVADPPTLKLHPLSIHHFHAEDIHRGAPTHTANGGHLITWWARPQMALGWTAMRIIYLIPKIKVL